MIAALVDRGTFVVPSLHFPKHFLEAFGSGLGFTAGQSAPTSSTCAR